MQSTADLLINSEADALMAGPQALYGYQLVRQQQAEIGLAAGVGHDLPLQCKVNGLGCQLLMLSQCLGGSDRTRRWNKLLLSSCQLVEQYAGRYFS